MHLQSEGRVFSLMITDLMMPAIAAPPKQALLPATTPVIPMPLEPPQLPAEQPAAAAQQAPANPETSPPKKAVDWARFASAVASIRKTEH